MFLAFARLDERITKAKTELILMDKRKPEMEDVFSGVDGQLNAKKAELGSCKTDIVNLERDKERLRLGIEEMSRLLAVDAKEHEMLKAQVLESQLEVFCFLTLLMEDYTTAGNPVKCDRGYTGRE